MFANGYVGTNADNVRIRRQEKERANERKKYEEKAAEKEQQLQAAGLKQFAATTTEALEHAFKNETIGLVTKADFVKKRTTIEDRLKEEQRKKQQLEEQALQEEKERKRRDKLQRHTGKLSFAVGGDDEEDESEDPAAAEAPPLPKLGVKLPDPDPTLAPSDAAAAQPAAAADSSRGGAQPDDAATPSSSDAKASNSGPDFKRPKKITKAPGVMTDFLPDREREQKEEELRNQLKKEYETQQNKIKSEPLAIVYSYWDGSGHRREIRVKKGDSIGNFLKAVKEQLIPDFRELRHVSVDNLLYVKEDIILPHHYTFYDLIASKARGKSGPLFDFGVHEDIRVMNDASREKNESHAGKVVERHWYDRNKHIFPASRWEVYDPDKVYDAYSIYG